MKREQDILKAAYEVADIDSDDYHTQIDCFIKGVEWGDEHPRKGLVDIEKTLKWLESCRGFILTAMDIEQFKKYMENTTL